MQTKELDSFKLSDAITFHDELNPKLWAGNKLRPEVKMQLQEIAKDFLEEMGIHDLDVIDITVSGSNAAYSYTKHSDLDLHILVNLKDLPNNEVYKELFQAKKTLYNDSHNITIHGVPVELYVQDASEPVVSLGEYSIKNDKWIKIPTKRRANFDQTASRLKYNKLLDIIKLALRSKNLAKVNKILKKIKQYRQAGLDKGGEFGPENLAYKALRSQGYITKLYALRDKLHSEMLTIENMYAQEDYHPNSKLWRIKKLGIPDNVAFLDKDKQGVAEGLEQSLAAMVGQDQSERNEYSQFVKSQAGGDWSKGAKMYAQLKKRPIDDIFGDAIRLNQFMKMKFDFDKFTNEDWDNYWLLAQHCDDNRDFQKNALSIIKKYQGTDHSHYKYLYDRISMGLTGKQKYGTQNVKEQGVAEAFNNPYKTKSEKSEYGDVDMLAKLPDGTYLSIMFNKQQDDDGEEITQVEFYRNNSQEVTGEGDAQRIFATVLASIQKYIKKHKPLRLSFSASKVTDPTLYYEPDQPRPNPESRAKLYDRLVQRYALAWGYRAFRADTGDLVIYELSRLKPAVVEDETLQYAAEKTPAINPYGGLKDRQYRGSISEMETDNQSSAKTGIYQSEVFGAKAYHSKCLEKGCDWESRRFDRIKQAQDAAKKHSQTHFKTDVAEASGYIPSEKEKNDPRFKTALTVDVHPYTMKKDAKKFGNKISRAGIPPTASPSGKF